MSDFEKITKIDASLNGYPSREKVFNIEMSDQEYRDKNFPLREEREKFCEIKEKINKVIELKVENAKNQSKISKRNPRKDYPKSDKGPMAPLQE